ncbi:hypothetical protein E1264_20080 [Actinomadura sp. KC216]|uniref:hypothetical protein n=1 Tax=Actinomadura sp. KC216 TaxID=2530370 RepID=UPI0010472551|nr:hypothetical protein [Actinomadura sp. KC216]TDB85776.1 hypothetical protein E1264_20080 [Actinomadura sp. KC216]
MSRPSHRSNWCGLGRNTFQLRPTLDFDSPLCVAIDARDQCVALVGAYSSAADADRPQPVEPPFQNRLRHLFIVFGQMPNSAAQDRHLAHRDPDPGHRQGGLER